MVTPCVGVWIETVIVSSSKSCIGGHTLRGCVDWNLTVCNTPSKNAVTPCVGVWIETGAIWVIWNAVRKSHPAWVCGLKQQWPIRLPVQLGHTLRGCVDWNPHAQTLTNKFNTVTPCVGVWIETKIIFERIMKVIVTPCVGVWIETIWIVFTACFWSSHPAWVCGLKHWSCV